LHINEFESVENNGIGMELVAVAVKSEALMI